MDSLFFEGGTTLPSSPNLADYPALLTIDHLSRILGLSKRTFYNRHSKNPRLLPPRTRLPGSNLLRWLRTVVEQWLLANTRLRTGRGHK